MTIENAEFEFTVTGHGFDNRWPNFIVKIDDVVYFNEIVNGTRTIKFPSIINIFEGSSPLTTLYSVPHTLCFSYTNFNYKLDILNLPDGSYYSKYVEINKFIIEGSEFIPNYRNCTLEVFEEIDIEQVPTNILSWNSNLKIPFTTPFPFSAEIATTNNK